MAKKANKEVKVATTVTKRRGRPARTKYQKVVIWVARLFNERLQALFLKRMF